MPIKIRRVTAVADLVAATVDPEIFDAELDPDQLRHFLASTGHLLVVARDGNRVIGQARAILHHQPDGPTELYVDNLGVGPAYLRRGIARRLLAETFRWGRENGCARGWVATETDNLPARALYDGLKSEPEATMSVFTLDLGETET